MHDGGDVLGILAVLRTDLVGIRLEGHVNAHGTHRLAVEARQLVRQLGIIRRAEALVRLVDVAAEGIVLTVGGEHHRHAQALTLGTRLQVVERIGDGDGGTVQVEQLAGQRIVIHHLTGIRQLGVDAEQQTDLLLGGHLADEVSDAGVGLHAPVLIHVQCAVLVEILELQTIDLQNGGHALHIGQLDLTGGFVRLNHGEITVRLEKLLLSGGSVLINLLRADVHNLRRRNGLALGKRSANTAYQHDDGQNQGQLLHTCCSFHNALVVLRTACPTDKGHMPSIGSPAYSLAWTFPPKYEK